VTGALVFLFWHHINFISEKGLHELQTLVSPPCCLPPGREAKAAILSSALCGQLLLLALLAILLPARQR